MFGKERSPELIRLLIDVILATLTWNRGGEHYHIAVLHEICNQGSACVRFKVFANLKALHQIKALPKVEQLGNIASDKI